MIWTHEDQSSVPQNSWKSWVQSACVTPEELSVGEEGRDRKNPWNWLASQSRKIGKLRVQWVPISKNRDMEKKHLRKTPSLYIYRHIHAHTVMLIYTHIPNAHVKTNLKKWKTLGKSTQKVMTERDWQAIWSKPNLGRYLEKGRELSKFVVLRCQLWEQAPVCVVADRTQRKSFWRHDDPKVQI